MPVQKRKQKHTSIFHAVVYTFLVFGIIFTQVSWAFAAEAPVPPAASNANAPKATTAPGAVEKSITDYLCTPDGEGKGTNALIFNCVNKLYRFSIAFGVSVAILFIIFAGYLYMSGSEKGVTEAKSIIENTAAGLLILFVSFLLLRQINPELTRFKSIQLPQIAPAGNTVDPHYVDTINLNEGVDPANPDSSTNTSWGAPHPENACGNPVNTQKCSSLLQNGVPCSLGSSRCYAQIALVERLKALKQYTDSNGGPSWTVSSAFPTSGTHQNPCHNTTGSCVDISASPNNADSYTKLCQAINTAGGFVYKNEAYNVTSTNQACGQYVKTKYGNNPHLHVGIP